MAIRFDLIDTHDGGIMVPSSDGDWVDYDDYKELEAKYNKLRNSDPYVREEDITHEYYK